MVVARPLYRKQRLAAVVRTWLEVRGLSTDQKGTKILARTFFNQLRGGGYTPNQIISIATELIDLVASEIRESDKSIPAVEDDLSSHEASV
jgi:hypothetical protein